MDILKCKSCSSYAMVPLEVTVEEEAPNQKIDTRESRFYTCHVCGDNWLSVREEGDNGIHQITFIHQMGMDPVLKRVGQLQFLEDHKSERVKSWSFFMDDQKIDEDIWIEKLLNRRNILKNICSN